MILLQASTGCDHHPQQEKQTNNGESIDCIADLSSTLWWVQSKEN